MHSFEVSLGYESVDRSTLLEITTPLIVYIWRRHGGTCKFGFEFHWDVNISFIIMWPLHSQSYCNISMKNRSNVIKRRTKIRNWQTVQLPKEKEQNEKQRSTTHYIENYRSIKTYPTNTRGELGCSGRVP